MRKPQDRVVDSYTYCPFPGCPNRKAAVDVTCGQHTASPLVECRACRLLGAPGILFPEYVMLDCGAHAGVHTRTRRYDGQRALQHLRYLAQPVPR